jgi:hypothetical protein
VAIRRPSAGAGLSKLASRAARSKINGGKDIVDADPSKRMPQQPESTSPSLTVSPAPLSAGLPTESGAGASAELPNAIEPHQRVPRWLVRIELFLRVMLRMYIGLAICVVPWWHAAWDQNPIFLRFSALGSIAVTGAARGLVSGLGLLNLWIAFQDAIRHRDG